MHAFMQKMIQTAAAKANMPQQPPLLAVEVKEICQFQKASFLFPCCLHILKIKEKLLRMGF